jgi:PAX-interacting protein 1
MIKRITEIIEEDQYFTKSLANNVIKLTCKTPDTYRSNVKHFKKHDIYFHTYQLKEERAFRVVLKYLHHSTDPEHISQELSILGHTVRNITNIRHRITKEPLNLFFIDLEPALNNKEVYNITALQNRIIHFEPPRVNKMRIPQCARCQQYGHRCAYCNKPYACVKCSGPHNSTTCTKSKDMPATCALCGEDHPANYKGCKRYHEILQGNNPHRTPNNSVKVTSDAPSPHTPTPPNPLQQQQHHRSYAEVTGNRSPPPDEPLASIKTFLEGFKSLFAQLLNQNSMILSMLSTLINKTH